MGRGAWDMERAVARALVCLALVLASGCAARAPQVVPDLAAELDCLREGHLGVVAAHRGQPDPSAAENAMSSFRSSLAAGVPWIEIDVATTRDGVLVLMHDDTLDRTTTGTGQVRDRSWAEIRVLRVRRLDGTVLQDPVPTLRETLEWGRAAGARFELDVKRSTRFADVVSAVQAARMVDRVLVITYSLEDAVTVHRLDPRLMISVSLDTPGGIEEARKVIDPNRMLGFTGTRDPQSRPFAALRAAGIEPIFGTLGRPGTRLDDVYLADGDGAEYVDLVKAGVVMIASDEAVAAQRAIGQGWRRCAR